MPRSTHKHPLIISREKDVTRGEEAYQKIRHSILKGKWEPAAPLSEYQLAAQFKLSRTPVREALTRLEQEGMVRTVPGRGTFVSDLTPHDIMEIYQVREHLESFAARLAAEQMSADRLLQLEHIFREMRDGAAAGAASRRGVLAVHHHALWQVRARHLSLRRAGALCAGAADDGAYRLAPSLRAKRSNPGAAPPLIRHAPHDTFSRFAREGARVPFSREAGEATIRWGRLSRYDFPWLVSL